MKNPFKIGDKVVLEKYYRHDEESQDWSSCEMLPLNIPLTIKKFGDSETRMFFEGYSLAHYFEKFKLATPNKICYKGNKERGAEIRKIFSDLGADLNGFVCGCDYYYFYMDDDKKVKVSTIILPFFDIKELLPVEEKKEVEYVEAIKTLTGIKLGKIYPLKDKTVQDGRFNNYPYYSCRSYSFKPSTKEAFDLQNGRIGDFQRLGSPLEESNLDKAKRLFPKGTKFIPPNLSGVHISKGIFRHCGPAYIICETEYNRNLYCYMNLSEREQWGKVINDPVKNEEEWQIGGWVELLEDYYGCHKGYKFQIEKIDNGYSELILFGVFKEGKSFPTHTSRCKWLGMNKPYTEPSDLANSLDVNINRMEKASGGSISVAVVRGTECPSKATPFITNYGTEGIRISDGIKEVFYNPLFPKDCFIPEKQQTIHLLKTQKKRKELI